MNDLLPAANDFVFKRIFGSEQHTDVLLAFLNALFDDTHEELLDSVEILNPTLEKTASADKRAILDIRAKTQRGDFINIEIQVANQHNIVKRALYYWAKMYAEQMNSGDQYDTLKRVISIAVLDFIVWPNSRYHAYFQLVERLDTITIPDIELHFLELKKLRQEQQQDSELYWWLRFIKGLKTNQLEEFKMRNMSTKKAVELLEVLSQNPEVRQEYEERQKALLDEKSRIATARERGMMQGKHNSAIRIAKALLAKGMAAEEVAEITALSIADIQKLQKRKGK